MSASDACCHRPRRKTVSDYASQPGHAGDIKSAPLRGEVAHSSRLIVVLAIWADEKRRVIRARFKATPCVSLIAFAELACELLEEGTDPTAIDAIFLQRRMDGVHPLHRDRAEMVAQALHMALTCRMAQ